MIEGAGAHPFGYARDWPTASLHTIDGVVQIWLEPEKLTRTGADRSAPRPLGYRADHPSGTRSTVVVRAKRVTGWAART